MEDDLKANASDDSKSNVKKYLFYDHDSFESTDKVNGKEIKEVFKKRSKWDRYDKSLNNMLLIWT